MSIWYRQGVYGGLTREAAEGLRKTERYFGTYNEHIYITSIRDGLHSNGSLHPHGDAFDFSPPKKASAVRLKEILGKNFDLVIEKDHWHIEYDPK